MRVFLLGVAVLLMAGCDYDEVERETGYKGKARVNPWLAAERYAERQGLEVKSEMKWTAPVWEDATWMMPAAVLSNGSFVGRTEEWVRGGGHLILLVEHATSDRNDWSRYVERVTVEKPLLEMLERVGMSLEEVGRNEVKGEEVKFDGEVYKIDASSGWGVKVGEGKLRVFASRRYEDGRVSVITDGRMFRNRWIGDHDHAALLDALLEVTGYDGPCGFMRGTGVSFFVLLGQVLWPVLIGLGVVVVVWLWKNVKRFGPMESAAEAEVLRGYEHHLEALGNFQWQYDRAVSLLAPLRGQVLELGQRASERAGQRDADFFQYLADLAELPRERVFRALAEPAPGDEAILTRTAADLQRLLHVLHK